MWLKLLVSNWKTVLIGTVIASLVAYGAVMNLRLQVAQAELGEKTAVIVSIRQEAQTYRESSQRIAKEISDAHAELLVKTEANAYANAKKRFGTVARCPASSLGTVGVLPTSHDSQGQAGSSAGADALPAEEPLAVGRTFIDACALDAGVVAEWQRWAVANDLPVEQ